MQQEARTPVLPRTGHSFAPADLPGSRALRVPRFWLVAWTGCVPLAFVNGIVRDAVVVERLGELRAHQMATGTLVTALGAYVLLLERRRPLPDSGAALRVGMAWASCTVLFEVGLGRVRGLPWSRILADYDLSAGRVWILVPLTTLIAPVVARTLRKRARGAGSLGDSLRSH
jgi:hypothetical protein